jgi:hypothetical protein
LDVRRCSQRRCAVRSNAAVREVKDTRAEMPSSSRKPQDLWLNAITARVAEPTRFSDKAVGESWRRRRV